MDGFVPQVCVPVLDTLIMVTGLVGHSLVIIILAGRWRRGRQLPHGTDSLLLGLSATDLLFTALFLITFAIPLIIIAAMYAKIYCFLRDTRQGCRTSHLLRYQSQVTHTSVLLVLVFMACWLPSYILMFLLVGKTVSNAPGYRAFGIFVRLLASSASVANPILYVFNSTKFRKDLLQVGRESYGAFRNRNDFPTLAFSSSSCVLIAAAHSGGCYVPRELLLIARGGE
uniref:G-protein coupled receptors family 1 profile domain-containing protein n=1 Tax=Scleropages formosus TaxID=113540 RepID=A0A8C9TD22_SCLFO